MTDPVFDDRRAPGSPANLWEVVGLCLVTAAALILLSGVAYALATSDSSTRLRIEVLSSTGANIVTAGLLLAGVVALMYRGADSDPARARTLFVLALAIGVVIVVLSIFSVWHLATIDAGEFNGPSGSWKFRVATILPRIAGGLVAAVAVMIANRAASLSGSRGSGGLPQG